MPAVNRRRSARQIPLLATARWLLPVLAGCWGLLSSANAETTPRVDQVKAAFIVNIARFVSWPSPIHGAFNLCLYRASALGAAADTLDGNLVAGHPLRVLRIGNLDTSHNCHALLIPGEQLAVYGWEASADPSPVLTIADLSGEHSTGLARDGVMVALVRKGGHLGFEVNLDEVQRGGLTMSSQLLKLATIVDRGPRP